MSATTTVTSSSSATTTTSSSSSSNIFQMALSDPSGLQDELLGPSYDYSSQIKTPSELGMSSNGSISTLAKDISGLTEYVKALVSGGSSATKTSYLGNKFFLKTGGTCTATDTGEQVDRYIYINNVPSGNIPFVSSAAGVDFKEFRGLIPGVMSELNNFNPFTILGAFVEGSNPDCSPITLQVIDTNNNSSTQTQYITTTDISNMDACNFTDGKNPVSGAVCKQSFSNIRDFEGYDYDFNIPDDLGSVLFFIMFGLFLIYIIFKLSTTKLSHKF